VFHQLTEDEIVHIVDLMLARVETQLANKDMSLEVTPAAKKLLAARGFDPVLGARPLRRTIQREIEDALSEKILYGEIASGEIIVVDVEENADTTKSTFTFRSESKPVDLPDTPPVALAVGDEDGPAAQAE
jgi:ATP-dependent Clp protease ATP-binding subunit ClpC